jgi:hypothetical protein
MVKQAASATQQDQHKMNLNFIQYALRSISLLESNAGDSLDIGRIRQSILK